MVIDKVAQTMGSTAEDYACILYLAVCEKHVLVSELLLHYRVEKEGDVYLPPEQMDCYCVFFIEKYMWEL